MNKFEVFEALIERVLEALDENAKKERHLFLIIEISRTEVDIVRKECKVFHDFCAYYGWKREALEKLESELRYIDAKLMRQVEIHPEKDSNTYLFHKDNLLLFAKILVSIYAKMVFDN